MLAGRAPSACPISQISQRAYALTGSVPNVALRQFVDQAVLQLRNVNDFDLVARHLDGRLEALAQFIG